VANPNYMLVGCAKACQACGDQQKARILKKAAAVEAKTTTLKTVLTSEHIDATAAFGETQRAEGAQAAETLEIIEKSVQYMQSDQFTALSAEIRENCQNRNELCAFWAVIGECDNNKAYMQTNCAPSCRSCHMIDIDARCPKLKDLEPALHPGDLNKMFERIVRLAPGNRTDSLTESELKEYADQKMPLYTVHIHSRPGDTPATEISAVFDKSLPPWVVTFDNFVTDEECAALIALGYEHEYKRSEDVGAEKFDGSHDSIQSERRTSENAWCSDHGDCRPQEVPQRLHERMATVMGIPANNSEDFQILKYEKGQFYRTHHDFIPHQGNVFHVFSG
jgi:prolyl 4-hydroxylase